MVHFKMALLGHIWETSGALMSNRWLSSKLCPRPLNFSLMNFGNKFIVQRECGIASSMIKGVFFFFFLESMECLPFAKEQGEAGTLKGRRLFPKRQQGEWGKASIKLSKTHVSNRLGQHLLPLRAQELWKSLFLHLSQHLKARRKQTPARRPQATELFIKYCPEPLIMEFKVGDCVSYPTIMS